MDDLSSMPHALLYQLRNRPENQSAETQKVMGPMEHRAFAREWTKDMPLIAAPSLAAAIPLYTAAKMAGLLRTRSPASVDEMAEAYRGVGEGLRQSGVSDEVAKILRRLGGS